MAQTAPGWHSTDGCYLILKVILVRRTEYNYSKELWSLLSWMVQPTDISLSLPPHSEIRMKYHFCFLLSLIFKLVLCFIFSSNMRAVMFMTCLQCSLNTWTCPLSCTCWTWFPNCLQWHTHNRLFTLHLFWSELSGGQDYPLLLLSLVHLPTQTALFIDQWPLVSDKPVTLSLAVVKN